MSRRRKGSQVRSVKRLIHIEPHVDKTLRDFKSETGTTAGDILTKVAYCIQNGKAWDADSNAI